MHIMNDLYFIRNYWWKCEVRIHKPLLIHAKRIVLRDASVNVVIFIGICPYYIAIIGLCILLYHAIVRLVSKHGFETAAAPTILIEKEIHYSGIIFIMRCEIRKPQCGWRKSLS